MVLLLFQISGQEPLSGGSVSSLNEVSLRERYRQSSLASMIVKQNKFPEAYTLEYSTEGDNRCISGNMLWVDTVK
jgi:hypothetical protein